MSRYLLLAVLCVTLSGCSTLGVYESEYACPASYNGRCVSISGAHKLAAANKDNAESDPMAKAETNKNPPASVAKDEDSVSPEESAYKKSLYKRLDTLVKEPNTPVVAPPQVMRVLLLPYKSEANELYMLRYVYFFVDEPKWIFGDSITAFEEG